MATELQNHDIMGVPCDVALLKRCSRCKEPKETSDFRKQSSRKDGLNPYCKGCQVESDPNRKARGREWYLNNKAKTIHRATAKRLADPEKMRDYKKDYYIRNSDSIKARVAQWQKDHPHVVAWRSLLRNALQKFGKRKSGRTIDNLGYSADALRKHIEDLWLPQMSWANYGEWHIDHIRPLVSFDRETPMHIVNAISNLQPLWATSRTIDGIAYEGNLNKHDRWQI